MGGWSNPGVKPPLEPCDEGAGAELAYDLGISSQRDNATLLGR